MNCRACREEIANGASICPRCRQFQSWWRAFVPVRGLVIVAAMAIAYLVTLEVTVAEMEMDSEYSIYKGDEELFVTGHRMHFTSNDCGGCVVTTGTLKNKTEEPWSDIHIQVTYYTEDGSMIDVHNSEQYGLVVGAGLERNFKVSERAVAEADSYARSEVEITKASIDGTW